MLLNCPSSVIDEKYAKDGKQNNNIGDDVPSMTFIKYALARKCLTFEETSLCMLKLRDIYKEPVNNRRVALWFPKKFERDYNLGMLHQVVVESVVQTDLCVY